MAFAAPQSTVSSWDELLKRIGAMPPWGALPIWAFRGQQCADWSLTTSLERSGSVAPQRDEFAMLHRFRRRAGIHLATHMVPDDSDTLAWLALLQHYGAPTRLLDFTASPYVALFFAFENADDQRRDRALWAINVFECQKLAAATLAVALKISKEDAVGRILLDQNRLVSELVHTLGMVMTGVIPVEPWRFDARQTAQQTLLMFPTNVSKSFEENLLNLGRPETFVKKIVVPDRLRPEILRQLATMNVTAASLFPGLDGYARSMYSFLTFDDLEPDQSALSMALDGYVWHDDPVPAKQDGDAPDVDRAGTTTEPNE